MAAKRSYADKNGKTKSKRRREKDTLDVDWGGIPAAAFKDAVQCVTSAGGAIRFGYTKDNSTYTLGLYDDGDIWTEYCPSPEGVEQWLKELTEHW